MLLFTATAGFSKTIKVDKTRLISLIGRVDDTTVTAAGSLLKLVDKSTDDIWIHLNSPGGYVDSGLLFIDAMNIARNRGVDINCVSTRLAASMAFNIMAYCDTVYTLPHTQLLFHPARIVSSRGLTASDLNYYGSQLSDLESKMQPVLRDMMGMDYDKFMVHYERETMWNAVDLLDASSHRWITIVDDVLGISDLHKVERQQYMFMQVDEPRLIIIMRGGIQW
jgi:ATP-dependent Clp protease protease subunit